MLTGAAAMAEAPAVLLSAKSEIQDAGANEVENKKSEASFIPVPKAKPELPERLQQTPTEEKRRQKDTKRVDLRPKTPEKKTPIARVLDQYPALFGTREVSSSNLKPFPKWNGTLKRYFSERKLKPGVAAKWEDFLENLDEPDFRQQLVKVNHFINNADYIIDPINWGVPDYWASPFQFFSKDGDCEDYAIAKYMSLKALGVPNGNMRIVILNDLNLQVIHAVLAVYHQGEAYILDNQVEQVLPASRIHHYQPIYSINETGWWRHRML